MCLPLIFLPNKILIETRLPNRTSRYRARLCLRKLVPFLAAQDTFKAQAAAKYLADEIEAKLAPAEEGEMSGGKSVFLF